MISKVKRLFEHSMKRNCRGPAKWNSKLKKGSTEKAIDRLYFKWKGFDNSFNNWINMKDIV